MTQGSALGGTHDAIATYTPPTALQGIRKGSGPGGKHENMKTYTPEEAQLVQSLVEAYSPRWTHIAKLLSEATGIERTSASVRNYYKRFTASKDIAEKQSDVRKFNRCQLCGQIKRGHICRPSSLSYVTPQQEAVGLTVTTSPAEQLLALSAREEQAMPPLAPAALEMLDTPSPLSTFSTVGPPSCSTFSGYLGSPMVPAATRPAFGAFPPRAAAAPAPVAVPRLSLQALECSEVGEEELRAVREVHEVMQPSTNTSRTISPSMQALREMDEVHEMVEAVVEGEEGEDTHVLPLAVCTVQRVDELTHEAIAHPMELAQPMVLAQPTAAA